MTDDTKQDGAAEGQSASKALLCCVPTLGHCCCGCRWHIEDFHHCTTVKERDHCVCSEHKCWICLAPEMDGFAYSGWSEHGMCEMWMPKQHNDSHEGREP